jgi:hypothetical protein
MATLREQVATMLREGRIPCRTAYRTWAGPAQVRHVCSGCGAFIEQDQMEFVADFGADEEITLHRECFYVWEDECRRLL